MEVFILCLSLTLFLSDYPGTTHDLYSRIPIEAHGDGRLFYYGYTAAGGVENKYCYCSNIFDAHCLLG